MAFCNQCGTELPAGARFCSECGTAKGSTAAATPATTPVDTAAAAPRVPPPGSLAAYPASSTSPAMWILPILALAVALAVGYLLLGRHGDDLPSGRQSIDVAANGMSRDGATASRPRAVDEASDAADAAGANSRGAAGTYVSATTLDSAFATDRDGAALRYPGPVTVTGVIATMVQPGDTPSLSMEGRNRFNYMIVNFPAGYRARLAPLSKGQTITVACDGARSLAGTTILSGCLLP